MKALSVKEPWASLIIFGSKDTENRVWRTLHRGPIVICASATLDHKNSTGWEPWYLYHDDRDVQPGFALGVVEIVGCDKDMLSVWDELGQFHFRLDNKRPFLAPFAVKGTLGMFNIDDQLVAAALATPPQPARPA